MARLVDTACLPELPHGNSAFSGCRDHPQARGLVGGLTLEEQAALEPVEVSRVWLESGWTRSLVACLELAVKLQ